MSLPTRIAAYEDCLALYARAANAKRGTRALLGTWNEAKMYQMRMHMVRTLIRDEAVRMYDSNDPRSGKCEYDNMSVTLKQDVAENWWVYVTPYTVGVYAIEDIDEEVEAEPEREPDSEPEDNPNAN